MDVDITSMKIDLMNVKCKVCKCNQLGIVSINSMSFYFNTFVPYSTFHL